MISRNKYRILIWIVVILLATNISMVVSIYYHKANERTQLSQSKETLKMPAQQRTRFFKEQLNLQAGQLEIFRTLNRKFNPVAHGISDQLELLRIEMVKELGKENSDPETLDSISGNIGKLHSELKDRTIEYYLQMKEVCTIDQQKKLNVIFMSVLKENEDVSLPKKGSGRAFRSE